MLLERPLPSNNVFFDIVKQIHWQQDPIRADIEIRIEFKDGVNETWHVAEEVFERDHIRTNLETFVREHSQLFNDREQAYLNRRSDDIFYKIVQSWNITSDMDGVKIRVKFFAKHEPEEIEITQEALRRATAGMSENHAVAKQLIRTYFPLYLRLVGEYQRAQRRTIPEWRPMHLAMIGSGPLDFARIYNEMYNPQHVRIPISALHFSLSFPRENPYTRVDRERITQVYGESAIREHLERNITGQFYGRMERRLGIPLTFRVVPESNTVSNEIERQARQHADEFEREYTGSFMIADKPLRTGDPVQPVRDSEGNPTHRVTVVDMGRNSDDMVIGHAIASDRDIITVELEPPVGQQLQDLEDAISNISDSIEHFPQFVSPSVFTGFHNPDGDSKPKKKQRKYYSAKTGLKKYPVIHDRSYMILGHDSIPAERYNNCEECFWYSLVFFNKEDKLGTKIIETDEDFEKVKYHFMKHFNKKHKDVVAKKMTLKQPEKMT